MRLEKAEERYIEIIQHIGVNAGTFVLATASTLTFLLSLLHLVGAILHFFGLSSGGLAGVLSRFGIVSKPFTLTVIDIIDVSLLGAILLVFAFGLKAVFLGRQYRISAFKISNINELKEILVGLIITLLGTHFLEKALYSEAVEDLMKRGIGLSAVILSLTLYSYILKRLRKETSASGPYPDRRNEK